MNIIGSEQLDKNTIWLKESAQNNFWPVDANWLKIIPHERDEKATIG